MSAPDGFSDNQLHAFVDGQLHADERERLLSAMEEDTELRERVCALHRTKEWVNLAFDDVHAPRHPLPHGTGSSYRLRMFGLAASLLILATGFLLGWVTSSSTYHDPLNTVVLHDITSGSNKVVLHIDRSDPTRFHEVLDSAEELLSTYKDKDMQVDVLANAGGIDLLRVDVSPYAQRIALMMRKYPRLHFIACTNTLQRLEEKGIKPVLIENTQRDTSAVQHIIHRLQEGWAYIRV